MAGTLSAACLQVVGGSIKQPSRNIIYILSVIIPENLEVEKAYIYNNFVYIDR
jgi:hypothetical protein